MTDLATWLLEQIAEDERRARACTPGPWRCGNWQTEFGTREDGRTTLEHSPGTGPFPAVIERDRAARLVLPSLEDSLEIGGYGDEPLEENASHIASWDPARVLAECDAKRRIDPEFMTPSELVEQRVAELRREQELWAGDTP